MEQARFVQKLLTQELYNEDEVIDSPSLSDFLMYATNGDPKEFNQLDNQNHSFDSDDQFEFSSELMKTSMDKNVVFCGKIIPYKENSVSQNTHKVDIKKQHKHHKDRWSFVRFFKKSCTSKSSFDLEKDDLKYEVPIQRVSLMASSSKSRWHLLVSGFGSIGHQEHHMHIRDLKKRQTSIRTKDNRDNNKSGGNGGGIWSRSIIRFLGCGGGGGGGVNNHHLNANMEIE